MLALCSGAGGQRGLPRSEGINNFGKVDERVYRGALPDAAGIRNLGRLGVKTIVDLRLRDEGWRGEAEAARSNGIAYTNVPLSGLHAPTDDQVTKVLALIERLTAPIFIHCEHGCDRTGTIIACYRLRHDGWTAKTAQREADLYGMSKLERGMRKYIEKFLPSP
jgi:protein tyrosine/serine phosphatase